MPSSGHEGRRTVTWSTPVAGSTTSEKTNSAPTLRLSADSANRRLMYSSSAATAHSPPTARDATTICSVHKTQLSILDSRISKSVCRDRQHNAPCAHTFGLREGYFLGQSSGSAASSFFAVLNIRCPLLAGRLLSTKILTVRFDSEEAAPHLRTSEWLATSPASHPIATLASAHHCRRESTYGARALKEGHNRLRRAFCRSRAHLRERVANESRTSSRGIRTSLTSRASRVSDRHPQFLSSS